MILLPKLMKKKGEEDCRPVSVGIYGNALRGDDNNKACIIIFYVILVCLLLSKL